VNRQGDYALRYTGNYFDLIEGWGYHAAPITFHEFMTKAEAYFLFSKDFMQIPGYIQWVQEIEQIEETAREYVANYIRDTFENNLLGMQDYTRWAELFRQKCDSVCASFWAQVNMTSLMLAKDLEMDEHNTTRSQAGNAKRLGGQTTTTDGTTESNSSGQTKTIQDVDTTQSTDSSTRNAVATVADAPNRLSSEVQYDWTYAADSVTEQRARAGDMNQHTDSTVDNTQHANSVSHGVSTTAFNNSEDNNTMTGEDRSQYTNKMFMQEKQWAINTAQMLQPLEWLRMQLRPMFYLLY
jgi:hypothetical protein